MPSIEVLEQVKTLVNELGNEAEILAARNETIPSILPPVSSIDSDMSNDGYTEMDALLKHYTEDLESLEEMAVDEFGEEKSGEIPVDDDSGAISQNALTDFEEFMPSESDMPEEDEAAEDLPSETIEEPDQEITEEFAAEEVPIDIPDDSDLDESAMASKDIPDGPELEEIVSEFDTFDDMSQDMSSFGEEDLDASDTSDIDSQASQQVPTDDDDYEVSFSEEMDSLADQDKPDIDEETDSEAPEFSISEEDFFAIRNTLSLLPRNLKLAIEQLFVDERHEVETIQPLIQMCIAHSSPSALAKEVYKITNRRIEIPKHYRRLSGQTYEKKQASLLYTVSREAWPQIRKFLLLVISIWLLIMATFTWLYRPLQATMLYREGLNFIAEDEVDKATDYFNYAWDGWPLFGSPENGASVSSAFIVIKGWKDNQQWLNYAREFRRRKHWSKTREFYEGHLLAKPRAHKARVEYSRFLSNTLGEYEHAIRVLDAAPDKLNTRWEEEFILGRGDVYFEWAQEDPAVYEKARYSYALALERNGKSERALLSMMRYFLKLQSRKEIQLLLPLLEQEATGKTSNPALAAEVYAALGEFQLREENRAKSLQYISLAKAADPMAPEPWFADALFWNRAGQSLKERNSYIQTLTKLENRESLTRNQLRMQIISLAGMGRYYNSIGTSSLAIKNYNKAVELYEDARKRNQIGASPEYGQVYLELGNIHYLNKADTHRMKFTLEVDPVKEESPARLSELEKAINYYNLADELLLKGKHESGLPNRELYRRAYAGSILGMDRALVDAYRIVRRQPDNYNTRIALGTILLKSGDYSASRLQYSRALELMEESLARHAEVLDPEAIESHQALFYRYVAVWNNLGVGRAMSAASGGTNEDYAAALTAFTMASEYLDMVRTDMTDMIQSGAVGIRDEDDMRVVDRIDNINFPRERTTFPYRNRLRLLGKEQASTSYLIYTDIPSDS